MTVQPEHLHGITCEHLGLVLDESAREVHLDGRLVDLTRTEFDVLIQLYRNPRRVLTAETLLSHLWNSAFADHAHPIEVYIHRLRKKLGESGKSSRYIHTIRGVGYRFEPDRPTQSFVTLIYDRSGLLRNVRTTSSHLWGWSISEITGSYFNPGPKEMLTHFVRLLMMVESLETVGVTRIHLSSTIQQRDFTTFPAEVLARLEGSGDHPQFIALDVTW